jgi:hypothetical protein
MKISSSVMQGSCGTLTPTNDVIKIRNTWLGISNIESRLHIICAPVAQVDRATVS